MLAHGSVLLQDHYNARELQSIVDTPEDSSLNEADKAIMRFAGKTAREPTSITAGDVDELRKQGLSNEDIFDIASAAAVRCFFSKTLDSFGMHPDSAYNELDSDLRQTLVVGRSIADEPKCT
jgi:alkylhydroperoxidase family enzyme